MVNYRFEGYSSSLTAPADVRFAITPDDTAALAEVTRAIYVGTGGNIAVRAANSASDVTFVNAPSGAILDIRVSHVRATGTTAANLVGLA